MRKLLILALGVVLVLGIRALLLDPAGLKGLPVIEPAQVAPAEAEQEQAGELAAVDIPLGRTVQGPADLAGEASADTSAGTVERSVELRWVLNVMDADTRAQLALVHVVVGRSHDSLALSTENRFVPEGALGLDPLRDGELIAEGHSPIRMKAPALSRLMWAKAPGHAWKSFRLKGNAREVEVLLHAAGVASLLKRSSSQPDRSRASRCLMNGSRLTCLYV